MLRPQGYLTVFGDGPMRERDSCQCGHCQQIIIVKPGSAQTVYLIDEVITHPRSGRVEIVTKEEPGAFCRLCMRPVCLSCHQQGRCHTWEKKIDESEARGRWMKAAGID